jgi:hypothetical protein
MGKQNEKKEWETPVMQVFMRTRGEESFLTTCKGMPQTQSGPGNADTHCNGSAGLCNNCSQNAGS